MDFDPRNTVRSDGTIMSGNIARDRIAPETKAAIHALLPKPFDAVQLLAALDAPAG